MQPQPPQSYISGPPVTPPPGAFAGYSPPRPPRQDHTALVIVVVVVSVLIVAAVFAVLVGAFGGIRTGNPTRPLLVFSAANVAGGTATLTVASASMAAPYTDFKVNMAMNGAYGMATNMMGSGVALPMDMSMGRYTVKVTWMDRDGSGTVNSEDTFTVSQVGGFLPLTTYQLVLLWYDGSQIAMSNWST